MIPCKSTPEGGQNDANLSFLVPSSGELIMRMGGGNVIVCCSVQLEPSLLGGMVVEVGDKYIDMSTQSKVKRIMQVLREAV